MLTKEAIFEIIKKNILSIVPDIDADQINIEGRLKDLGVNSIDRMDIVTQSMADVKVKIPLVEFGKVNNIEGLVNLLYEKQQG